MRVLVVTNMYPTEQFPALGTFVRDQVEALRRKGVEIVVLPIIGKKKDKVKYLKGVAKVLFAVSTSRYDLVHAHYVFSGVLARLQFKYPVLVSFHGAGEMEGWQGQLCKILSPFVDGMTVTSQRHKSQLGNEGAHIVPCGVDFAVFKPMPQEAVRLELGLPADKKLVLFAADMRPEKRYDIARDAVSLLKAGGEDVELVTVTGKPHSVVPKYMNACDALVLPSEYEGSPVVIKEAMACNLPIVAADVGDVAEVIGQTDGCYICQRTPSDVAEKLMAALDRGCRTDGRTAVAHLQIDQLADKMIQIYGEVIESKRARWDQFRRARSSDLLNR